MAGPVFEDGTGKLSIEKHSSTYRYTCRTVFFRTTAPVVEPAALPCRATGPGRERGAPCATRPPGRDRGLRPSVARYPPITQNHPA